MAGIKNGQACKDGVSTWVALAAVSFAALVVRLLNWRTVFSHGSVRFLEPDAFYHMRRIVYAAQHRLALPDFDPYLNFPDGLHCIWVPLFDQVAAAVALVLGFGSPSVHLIERVGAILPPVLGALTVPLVFLIARFFLDRRYSLLAALVFAFLPYNLQISVLGRPDHHVGVVFESSLLLLGMLHLQRQKRTAAILAWAAVVGLLLVLMLDLWSGGSLLFVVMVAGYFGLALPAACRDRAALKRLALGGGTLFASAALLLWPLASRTHWNETGQIAWIVLSRFQVVLLALCALCVLGAALLLGIFAGWKAGADRRLRQKLVLGFLGVAAATALLLVVNAPLLYEMAGPSQWLVKQDRFLQHIVENLPLTVSSAVEDFTWLVFLFPILLAVLMRRLWKQNQPFAAVWLFVWTVTIGACTLFQERFADLFSVVVALLIACCAELVLGRGSFIRERLAEAERRLPGARLGLARIVCVCALLFAAWPTFRWLIRYARSASSRDGHVESLYEVGEWLRDHTPATDGYFDLSVEPAYGILANWAMGHPLMYISRRPVVACNFGGVAENAEANLAPFKFFTATDPEVAAGIMDRYSARYVVVEETVVSGQPARMLDILELPQSDFFSQQGVGAHAVFSPTQKGLDSMAVRLYFSGTNTVEGFTLVFESSRKSRVADASIGVFRVFERTP